MAQSLVTQVSQDQDPAKQAELAKLQAEQKKKKEQEKKASPTSEGDVEEEQPSCCWRIFCCSNRRPKQRPPKTAATSSSASESSSSSTVSTQSDSTTSGTKSPETSAPTPKALLPPQAPEHKGKKTLVLDLDETLVHSSFSPVPGPDFVISIELEGVTHRVYVQKRPGVDQFLDEMGPAFEVVVFTASLDKYANPVLDILDPKGHIKHRLFREACVYHYGNYVKDLSLLGRRLEDSLIIDNSPFSYLFQQDNAIPITSWFNDKSDRELYDLVPFLLEQIAPAENVAHVITERKKLVMSTEGVDMVGDEEEEDDEDHK